MDLMRKISAPAGQKGQALLIVLLVMVVGLTIGLSLATRSVTDIKISTQLEESSRAFSAAEAGIEAALKGESEPATPVQIGNATYIFSKDTAGGTDQPLALGKIGIADTYTVWLTSHDTDGNLQIGDTYDYDGTTIDICWGEGGETTKPAMEVSVVYRQGGIYKITRGAYDPEDGGRRNNNHFADTDDGVNCGGGFAYGKTSTLPAGVLVALRLRPFYLETNAGVEPQDGFDLSSQGLLITSTGTAGDTTRKVEVVQSYPSLPAIFDYLLFSGTGVSR